MENNLQPTPGKTAPFQLYRYQLVVDKAIQLNIEGKYNSAEEIRAAKNEIFQNLITNERFYFQSSKSEISSKLMYADDTISYFKIGVKRQLKHINKDFSEDYIENYPNIVVAINNDPNVQKIAIQTNTLAFRETNIVSRLMEESIDKKLKPQNLSFFLEPIFDRKDFWDMVRRYKNQITQLSFDLVSPNLANISKNLTLDLKQLYEDTNTQKTKIELNADKESHLAINEESPFINGLVNYSAEGGGNIALKVDGLRNKLHTAQSAKEFNVDEQLLKSNDWEAINEVFKNIIL